MSRVDRLLAGTVVAAALAFGWSGLTAGYEGPYDEGNTLCAATRVLAGETPYRDFWLLHPPGTTWLLAGAFRVFGATLGVERAVKVVVVALTAALVFLLARRAARPLAAAAAALLFVVLPTQTL
ncbi:MAG TPA: glycosyltransferase family 39 protein, partial [Thermoanaerobaculia bacterium]|nr:glycosyltransferase family 39 protein [Thermoanaerobaculia bacterium]